MAKNDTILIDGILDDRVAERIPSGREDEAFEFFAFERVLRDYDLSVEELQSGWVDGENDGGIDGFYILVNGHLLVDPESFMWPKTGCELDVWIVTCKHHETFKQAPLDNLVASLNELLNLSLVSPNLKGLDLLLRLRAVSCSAYRKTSPRLSQFTLHFAPASLVETAPRLAVPLSPEVNKPMISRKPSSETFLLPSPFSVPLS